MFIMLFKISALDHGPEFIPYLIIGVGSWAFWTLCAGVVWRVMQRVNGSRPERGTPRWGRLGKTRD
jgi:hypothetical protein